MIITEQMLDQVRSYGARNYPASYMVTLLAHTAADREFLRMEFANPTSPLWEAWQAGSIEHENSVDEYLEKALETPGEGAHDVAKALHFRRKNRGLDELKKDLFGV